VPFYRKNKERIRSREQEMAEKVPKTVNGETIASQWPSRAAEVVIPM
jgi:hypothetical protein